MMNAQRLISNILLISTVLLIAGCTAGPNIVANTPNGAGSIAGFWLGIWHGLIYPIALGLSFASDNIQMYEVHNNGAWYNFGFVLGMLGLALLSNILHRLVNLPGFKQKKFDNF